MPEWRMLTKWTVALKHVLTSLRFDMKFNADRKHHLMMELRDIQIFTVIKSK